MLEIILVFILATIFLIALGVTLEKRKNKALKQDFESFESKKILLTESEAALDFPVDKNDTYVLVVSAKDLTNRGSFCYRIMKQTGVQRLPMEVWLSERGELEGKHLKRTDAL
jgi:hypothetical protein